MSSGKASRALGMSPVALALSFSTFMSAQAPVAIAESCYSVESGYRECWNGCCGPATAHNCCSSTAAILGLTIGGGFILVVVFTALSCWLCKDCGIKACIRRRRPGNESRRQAQRSDRHHTRRVVVHPVEPPDYDTVTSTRAPSVQPGHSRRTYPLSPPPPYVETVPPPPSSPPPLSRHRTPRQAGPYNSLSETQHQPPFNRPARPGSRPGVHTNPGGRIITETLSTTLSSECDGEDVLADLPTSQTVPAISVVEEPSSSRQQNRPYQTDNTGLQRHRIAADRQPLNGTGHGLVYLGEIRGQGSNTVAVAPQTKQSSKQSDSDYAISVIAPNDTVLVTGRHTDIENDIDLV